MTDRNNDPNARLSQTVQSSWITAWVGLLVVLFGCNSHISLVWLSDLRVIRVHACGAIT